MMRKQHSAERIINIPREAQVHLGQGMSVPEVFRKLSIIHQIRADLPPLVKRVPAD